MAPPPPPAPEVQRSVVEVATDPSLAPSVAEAKRMHRLTELYADAIQLGVQCLGCSRCLVSHIVYRGHLLWCICCCVCDRYRALPVESVTDNAGTLDPNMDIGEYVRFQTAKERSQVTPPWFFPTHLCTRKSKL
jgi:hypothetical protein